MGKGKAWVGYWGVAAVGRYEAAVAVNGAALSEGGNVALPLVHEQDPSTLNPVLPAAPEMGIISEGKGGSQVSLHITLVETTIVDVVYLEAIDLTSTLNPLIGLDAKADSYSAVRDCCHAAAPPLQKGPSASLRMPSGNVVDLPGLAAWSAPSFDTAT